MVIKFFMCKPLALINCILENTNCKICLFDILCHYVSASNKNLNFLFDAQSHLSLNNFATNYIYCQMRYKKKIPARKVFLLKTSC